MSELKNAKIFKGTNHIRLVVAAAATTCLDNLVAAKAPRAHPDQLVEVRLPLVALFRGLIEVFELPLRRGATALVGTGPQCLLTVISVADAGAVDLVAAPVAVVPTLAAAVGVLDDGPGTIISQGGHPPVNVIALPLDPEFPVHWVAWVVAVTAVDDAVHALEAFAADILLAPR